MQALTQIRERSGQGWKEGLHTGEVHVCVGRVSALALAATAQPIGNQLEHRFMASASIISKRKGKKLLWAVVSSQAVYSPCTLYDCPAWRNITQRRTQAKETLGFMSGLRQSSQLCLSSLTSS